MYADVCMQKSVELLKNHKYKLNKLQIKTSTN